MAAQSMIAQSMIKEFAPFAYFAEQSSVISGLGGNRQPPDPRYCFHTNYEELAPGIAIFQVRLVSARATFGEMTIRIHAYRPDSGLDVSLVASTQYTLENLTDEDVDIRLRISAIPGVAYAVYGYLSEPSNLMALNLTIVAEQLGGDTADSYATAELGKTAFGETCSSSLSQVIGDTAPNLSAPQSQPFTWEQLQSSKFQEIAVGLPSQLSDTERWVHIFILRTLKHYGFLMPGARGLLLGTSETLALQLRDAGCQIVQQAQEGDALPPAPTNSLINVSLQNLTEAVPHCDFIIANGTLDGVSSYSELINHLNAALKCLLRGGLGIYIFNYWPDQWNLLSEKRFFISETVIRRITLHIIGHESAVVQLLLPAQHMNETWLASGIPFGFIVLR